MSPIDHELLLNIYQCLNSHDFLFGSKIKVIFLNEIILSYASYNNKFCSLACWVRIRYQWKLDLNYRKLFFLRGMCIFISPVTNLDSRFVVLIGSSCLKSTPSKFYLSVFYLLNWSCFRLTQKRSCMHWLCFLELGPWTWLVFLPQNFKSTSVPWSGLSCFRLLYKVYPAHIVLLYTISEWCLFILVL